MSAGARRSAINALREDADVIVIEKTPWFKNLHSTIHHAAMHKNFEDYLYDPLMEILGTYAKTCSHEALEASVIPQGCFELKTDSPPIVNRRLSDLLFILHSTIDLDDPQLSKSRLGGWLEAKPWTQAPKNKKKAANADTEPVTGESDSAAQDKQRGKGITTEADEDKDAMAEFGEQLKGTTVGTDTELEDIVEVVELDITDEGDPATSTVGDPSIEDASALALDPKEVIRRMVEDLPQLCQQAYFAFHHFVEDVLYVLLTYGMTFSCFRFTRPANWDTVRGNKEGTVDAPTVIFSNERMVFPDQINPRLLQAFRLMTASLGLSYQPSWFDPPAHDMGEPDLSVASTALAKYGAKLKGDPASPETSTSSSKDSSPNYSPTASEDAAPVGELGCGLRSGKGRSTTPARSAEPVAENEGLGMPDSSLEQQDRADAASSDVDDSPLNRRLRPKLARSGHARQVVDVPMTSGVPGAVGPSTKDTHSVHAPVLNDSASGVNSKDNFTTPKDRDKQIRKRRGKARQRKNTSSRMEANDPPLPALPVNNAPTGDGLGGSESQVLGHRPTGVPREATGGDSQTGARPGAKSCKRKGRPSSPLGADIPNPDATEDSAPAMAGPSKKRRLVPHIDEQPADDSAGGPSRTSCMDVEVSAGATHARDPTATERVCDPLTAPERARLNPHVYKSHARKRAAKTAETAAPSTEVEVPRPRTRAATTGSSRVRDPPPKERGKKTCK